MALTSFTSSALGSPHVYRAGFADQIALVVLARAGAGGKLACTVSQGTSYFEIMHTADQVCIVMKDFNAAEVAAQ